MIGCHSTVAQQNCALDLVHIVLTVKRQFSNTWANKWNRPPLSSVHDLRVNTAFVTMAGSMWGTETFSWPWSKPAQPV